MINNIHTSFILEGIIRCNVCKCGWRGKYYYESFNKLECPYCGSSSSSVIHSQVYINTKSKIKKEYGSYVCK